MLRSCFAVSRHLSVVMVLLLHACALPEEGFADPEDIPAAVGTSSLAAVMESGRRYDEVRQKSTHNSYQRMEALIDQLVYHRARSIELDIHTGKSGWSEVAGNWYVYHANIVDPGTTCHRLSDCLNELRAFHQMNPEHEVVTVWIDVKDAWKSGFNPADLDNRIAAHIPASWILRPADLMAACPSAATLQQAVTGACGWPLLSSLAGKFVFVLTGGDVSSSTSILNTYVASGASAASRTAFIAPNLTAASQISGKSYVVFFNLERGNMALAAQVYPSFVSRVWGINSASDWSLARSYFAHHIATDKVNFHQDSWAVSHNANGWPFECFSACTSTLAESVHVLGMAVSSEDIWGSSDHFRFRYGYTTTDGNIWTASVSTVNSHVEEWGKGCLMARQTTSSGSPYFAVCRAADEHKLRIQWRTSLGGGSSAQEVDIVPDDTIDQESLTYLRLYVYNASTCAAGYGSQDGVAFTLIGYKCFASPLYRQGVAASSHGGGLIKFLFTNLSLGQTLLRSSNLPSALSIGSVYSAREFDSVF